MTGEDRRQGGASLQELAGLLERLGHGALFWNLDLRVIGCNRLAGEFYGLGERLQPGMSYYEVVAALPQGGLTRTSPVRDWQPLSTPDPPEVVIADFEREQAFEMHFPGPPPRTVISNRAMLRGGILASVTTDVTNREELAAALAREKSYLETMLETVDEGVALIDEHRRVVSYNPRMLALHDIDPASVGPGDPDMKFLTSFGFMQALPEGEREEIVRGIIADVARSGPGTSRAERTLPSGLTLAISRTVLPDGRSVVVSQDVTRAATVARERARLAAIVDNIRDGVALYDGEGRVLAYNEQALRYFAVPNGAIREGDHFTEVVEQQRDLDHLPPEEQARHRDDRIAFALNRSDGPAVTRRELGDGRVLSVSRTLLGDSTLFVYHDMTAEEERRLLQEKAQREAEEASRLKSEFLARVSHELRTPMQGVLGMAAVLERTDLDEAQRRALDVIRSSGVHLLRLIEDLLTLSALEAEGLSLHPETLPLARPVGDAVEIVRPQAAERGLSLDFDPAPLDGVVVSVDPTRLRQILINLLGNAVRFTSSGGVRLTASAAPAAEGERYAVEISVADTGPGIPAGAEETIFQSFRQLAPAADAVSEGVGMGLPMARGLARLMGGDVTVRSPEEGGSVFTLSLELPRAAAD